MLSVFGPASAIRGPTLDQAGKPPVLQSLRRIAQMYRDARTVHQTHW